MTEVKSLSTEKHTEEHIFLRKHPHWACKFTKKVIKEWGKFLKHYVCKEPLPPKHTCSCWLQPNTFRGVWSSVKCTKILIWPHFCCPYCINLYLTTLQINQRFDKNVWRGAKAGLKRELGSPALFLLPSCFFLLQSTLDFVLTHGGRWELKQMRVMAGACRSTSSVDMLPSRDRPGLQDPKWTSTCKKKKLVLNVLSSLLGSTEISSTF